MTSSCTNLDLIDRADNCPYPDNRDYKDVISKYYNFVAHDGRTTLGLMPPVVAQQALDDFPEIFTFVQQGQDDRRCLVVNSLLVTFEARTSAMEKVGLRWKEENKFDLVKTWRGEQYAVYNPTGTAYLTIERALSVIFGVVTYGVHMTMYTQSDRDGSEFHLWTPRRSKHKQTFPNMLDNSVAGGVDYPDSVLETLVRECQEEAGLDPELVARDAVPVGAVSYIFIAPYPELHDDDVPGLYQPEVEYVYDLKVSDKVVPHPVDGEVSGFELMSIEKVKQELALGSFKPNTALVLIDFFIRHGLLTAEEEPHLLEIMTRLHRRIPHPLANFTYSHPH